MTYNILLVDDDENQAHVVEQVISSRVQHKTTLVTNGQKAIDMLTANDSQDYDLVLLDLSMPDVDGLDVLNAVRPVNPDVPIIVCTGYDEVDNVVKAMKAGATDFVRKTDGIERLRISVQNALRMHALNSELARLRRNVNGRVGFRDLVGASPLHQQVLTMAKKVANSDIPVLLEGASGSGKELLARAIHGGSARSEKPFVSVNCSAILPSDIEAALFGHERGSAEDEPFKTFGKIREAGGGTLFLDEIDSLPQSVQIKLMRLLQQQSIEPVGSSDSIHVDVRLIVSTQHHLEDLVGKGEFRDDLYYRLSVFPITLPSLRDRQDDIVVLAKHYMQIFALSEDKRINGMTKELEEMLEAYHWPGNIRQLKNAVFRAVVLCNEPILGVEDFPQIKHSVINRAQLSGNVVPIQKFARHSIIHIQNKDGALKPFEEIEKEVIASAMALCRGNLSETANRLGIGRSTLYRKMQLYGLGHKKHV